jgi:hypothetical protein
LLSVSRRQELIDVAVRMTVDDFGENVGQICEWIDVLQLTGLDQRGDGGPVFGTAIGRGLIVPGVRRSNSRSDIRFTHSPGGVF